MSEAPILKISGLFTSFNEFSEVPEGALSVADNIDIIQNSIAQPRRGFDRDTASYTDANDRTDAIVEYQLQKIVHHGNTIGAATKLSYKNGSVFTDLESITSPANRRLKFVGANQNLYYTSAIGLRVLDAYNGTPRAAGAYKGLDITSSTSASSSAWLAAGYSVAYRMVWVYQDANKNYIFGSPSQREIYTNSSSVPKAVDLAITIPAGVTTNWILQLYRSDAVNTGEPSDELYQVYETNPDSTAITNKTITITDIVPESLLTGATLYTSPSQEGIGMANEPPPLVTDLTYYDNCVFGFDTVSKHRFFLTLISVGGSAGIAVADTVGVGGITYTGAAAETPSSGIFRVYSPANRTFVDANVAIAPTNLINIGTNIFQNGDAITLSTTGTLPSGLAINTTYYVISSTSSSIQLSLTKGGAAVSIASASGGGTHTVAYSATPAQQIAWTAQSLVRAINQDASSTVYAYYVSGSDDLPGQILLEERSIGGNAFSIVSSRATCWTPTGIPTSGTTIQSTNDDFATQLRWTKPNEPESWPLANSAFVGSLNDTGLRAIALHDAIYMFNKTGQVYKLTGKYPNYQIDKIEDSVKLLATETAVVLNNKIYGLTDQGVTVLADDTKIISRPIEQDLLRIISENQADLQTMAFGVSYESDRKYLLFLPTTSADTYPTQTYVYNTFTNAWTHYTVGATCGLVDLSDILYLGEPVVNRLKKERKDYSFLDYADYGFTTSIATIVGTQVTVSSDFDSILVGDVLFQSASLFAQVIAVDPATQTITIDTDPGLAIASTDILHGIPVVIQWAPATMGNPGLQKQFSSVSMLFKSYFVGQATLGFSTDLQQSISTVPVVGPALSLWGLFPWGAGAWGGVPLKKPMVQWIPRSCQRASQLTISFTNSWAFSNWILQGLAIFGVLGSEKINKS